MGVVCSGVGIVVDADGEVVASPRTTPLMLAVIVSQQLFTPDPPLPPEAFAKGSRITSSVRNEAFRGNRALRGDRAWDVLGRDISSKTDGAT